MVPDKKRIAIVDDDPPVRDALQTIFSLEGFETETYADGGSFLAQYQSDALDAIFLDVNMPDRSGLDVLASLGGKDSKVPVFIISGQGDIPMAVAAIKGGAVDFIEKPFDARQILAQLRALFLRQLTPSATQDNVRAVGALRILTPRERDVLDKIAHGASNKEAGRLLGISPRTIEVHRARIMEKLNARNTADLVRIIFSP
jgi:two-component system, LuxR family, response regulator FixJ